MIIENEPIDVAIGLRPSIFNVVEIGLDTYKKLIEDVETTTKSFVTFDDINDRPHLISVKDLIYIYPAELGGFDDDQQEVTYDSWY